MDIAFFLLSVVCIAVGVVCFHLRIRCIELSDKVNAINAVALSVRELQGRVRDQMESLSRLSARVRALEPATDEDREQIIAEALETDEGRSALAQSMIEPIRRSLEYSAVGRRLLMVDDLPQGAMARYERDVASIAGLARDLVPEVMETVAVAEPNPFGRRRALLVENDL